MKIEVWQNGTKRIYIFDSFDQNLIQDWDVKKNFRKVIKPLGYTLQYIYVYILNSWQLERGMTTKNKFPD